MKLRVLVFSLLCAAAAFGQSGRNVTLNWTDPNVGLTGQTYDVYRAAGACPVQPVQPAPPAPQLPPNLPAFPAAIATGITTKTYVDANVPIGVWCYSVDVLAGGLFSTKAAPASSLVVPNAVTITVVIVQ